MLIKKSLFLDFAQVKQLYNLECADYPYSIEQHKAGKLLHEKSCRAAQRVFGIDISEEGIAFLKSLGYKDVFAEDVERLGKFKTEEKYDVVMDYGLQH